MLWLFYFSFDPHLSHDWFLTVLSIWPRWKCFHRLFTEFFPSSIFIPLSSHWKRRQSWAYLLKADTLPQVFKSVSHPFEVIVEFLRKRACHGRCVEITGWLSESVFSFHHGFGEPNLGCAPSTYTAEPSHLLRVFLYPQDSNVTVCLSSTVC